MSTLTNVQIREKLVAELVKYRTHLAEAMIAEKPMSQEFNDNKELISTPVFSDELAKAALSQDEIIKLNGMSVKKTEVIKATSTRAKMALNKCDLVCNLITALPSIEDVKDVSKKSSDLFKRFATEFDKCHVQLEALRRNDTKTDKYLVPFLKAVAGILLCCTVVLAPLAYYSIFSTTGANVTGRIADTLENTKEVDAPPQP